MSAKVKLTINGRPVEADAGTLVIEAAKSAGAEIPHYCYHPALGNPGNCRLCVVEVEKMPKLQVSCRLPVAEGMVVKSNSPAALRAQASSLELHLVNHPLDCPVCDQAGECALQDYYMQIGLYKSSVREDKEHKDKRIPVGPQVMLDQERCILCTRCTRFVDNVTQTHELGLFNRGDREKIDLYPGKTLDNPYAGNVVDICPVGALTDRDFRFKVRVWYLEKAESVCDGCSRGCSIEMHASTRRWHTGGARIARYKPRHNPEVNGYWICDEGRYGYKKHDENRYGKLRRKENGQWRQLSWAEGAAALAKELQAAVAKNGAEGLAFALSGGLSNEDLFMARKLIERLKPGMLVWSPEPDQIGEEDKLLRKREKVANLRGAQALGFGSKWRDAGWPALLKGVESGKIWGLYAAGRDPLSAWGEQGREAAAKLKLSVYHGAHANPFAESAHWVLPAATHAEEEGTFTNFEGRVQRFAKACEPIGDARPEWLAWRDLLRALGADATFESARDVFAALSRDGEFAGLRWDELGPHGRGLGAASREEAAA